MEQIGTALGIDFTSEARPDLAAPSSEDADRFEVALTALSTWEKAAFAQPGSDLPGYSTELDEYMSWAESNLSELQEMLIEREPPIWELDILLTSTTGISPPLPRLRLHRLLSLRAQRTLETGEREAADRSLEAAWRLRNAGAQQPDLISQIINAAQARRELFVLRSFCTPGERWLARLLESDTEATILTALQFEGWATLHYLQNADYEKEHPVSRMSVPFSLGGLGEATQHAVERLRVQDPRILRR